MRIRIRRWWKKAQKPDYKTDSKVLKRLKKLELFEGKHSITFIRKIIWFFVVLGFPNQAVYDAYQTPKINSDQSKFTWAMPQLELIRE